MTQGSGPVWSESLREYGRGLGGGFLFSMPLLYTMEVWWAGFTLEPLRLLAALGATFALLCAYNAYAGLRHDSTPAEIAIDSVEELGLGLVTTAVILWLLGRITTAMPPIEVLNKIVIAGLFVAVGFSVGTAQLGGERNDQGVRGGRQDSLGSEIVLGICGAFLIAANIAPTQEILVLATEIKLWHLLGIMAVSLVLAAILIHHSHFVGSARFADTSSGDVLLGSVMTYASALVAAAGMLWLFDRFGDHAPQLAAAQVVVLGLPAVLGAAAGRLLLR